MAHRKQYGKQRPEKSLPGIETLRIAKERHNAYGHNGTDTSKSVCGMIGAKDGVDLANLVSDGFHEVGRWEMVRIFSIVECGTKFNVCLRVHTLVSTSWSSACNVNQYFEPISKVSKPRNKQALRACMALLGKKEKLEKFVS